MDTFIVLCEFFGGLILFWGIGWLIGHLLKLDKHRECEQHEIKRINKIDNSEDDKNDI